MINGSFYIMWTNNKRFLQCFSAYNRLQVYLEGETFGDISKKEPAVCVSSVTHRTFAVSSHRVGDSQQTSINVFHLIGPVPITGPLFSPVMLTQVDWILSSTPTDDNMIEEQERTGQKCNLVIYDNDKYQQKRARTVSKTFYVLQVQYVISAIC